MRLTAIIVMLGDGDKSTRIFPTHPAVSPTLLRIAFLRKRRYMSQDIIVDRHARLCEVPFQRASAWSRYSRAPGWWYLPAGCRGYSNSVLNSTDRSTKLTLN